MKCENCKNYEAKATETPAPKHYDGEPCELPVHELCLPEARGLRFVYTGLTDVPRDQWIVGYTGKVEFYNAWVGNTYAHAILRAVPIIPSVTIDGHTITYEQFQQAKEAGIRRWETYSRGEEPEGRCEFCKLFRYDKKSLALHEACPVWDRSYGPDHCCKEWQVWNAAQRLGGVSCATSEAAAVLARIKSLDWHAWASKYAGKDETKAAWLPKAGDRVWWDGIGSAGGRCEPPQETTVRHIDCGTEYAVGSCWLTTLDHLKPVDASKTNPEHRITVLCFDADGKQSEYSFTGTPDWPRIERETIGKGMLAVVVKNVPKDSNTEQNVLRITIKDLKFEGMYRVYFHSDVCRSWWLAPNEIGKAISQIQTAIREYKAKQEPQFKPGDWAYDTKRKQPVCLGGQSGNDSVWVDTIPDTHGLVESDITDLRPLCPADWTREIAGVKVRAYKDDRNRVLLVYPESDTYGVNRFGVKHHPVGRELCRLAGIPIMPYALSKGNYAKPE